MSWAGADQINIEEYRARRGYRRAAPVSGPTRTHFGPSGTLICFSHLRWNFVYQRPQHLMRRFARDHRVIFVEEPVASDAAEPWLDFHAVEEGIWVLVPRIPDSFAGSEADSAQRALLENLLAIEGVRRPVLYYFTPLRAAIFRPYRRLAGGVRLHGRALRISRRPAGHGRAGARSPRPRRSRLYRRRQPLRGQAPPPSERARLPQQRRCRAISHAPERCAPNRGIRRRCRGPASAFTASSTSGSTSS